MTELNITKDLEEEIEEPIDSPSDIIKYVHKESGQIFEFQKFPNLGNFRKFENPLITNYVVTTVRLGAETLYGKVLMPKQMDRLIMKNNLQKIDS